MKLLMQSIMLTIVLTVLTGVIYPLVVTGIAQVAFKDQANGSLLEKNGQVVGSEFLAQQFTGEKYFWPRPSAGGYATVPSGASNYGPTSQKLHDTVATNAATFRAAHKLPVDAPVPADMVYASGSGLDPHISPEAARLQVVRVAAARGVGAERIAALVEKFVELPQWGFLGEARVNVLKLNLALDGMK
jgi:K+-transporting ATPase ATPase C chain